MMPSQVARPDEPRDQRPDKFGELVPFPPTPDAASDTPGPDLGPVAAARIEHWCRAYDIPLSTVRALRAQRKGPKTFEIGRLVFCMRVDWDTWLEGLATVGGSGPLSPPAGRLERRTNRGTTADTTSR
jgi:hypothetical protein